MRKSRRERRQRKRADHGGQPLKFCVAVVKEKAVETTMGCILRLKINIAVLDINGEAWYNVTKISAYQSK